MSKFSFLSDPDLLLPTQTGSVAFRYGGWSFRELCAVGSDLGLMRPIDDWPKFNPQNEIVSKYALFYSDNANAWKEERMQEGVYTIRMEPYRYCTKHRRSWLPGEAHIPLLMAATALMLRRIHHATQGSVPIEIPAGSSLYDTTTWVCAGWLSYITKPSIRWEHGCLRCRPARYDLFGSSRFFPRIRGPFTEKGGSNS